MKSKSGHQFPRRFQGNGLAIELPGGLSLDVPLQPSADKAPVPIRGWKARQGGAQCKTKRGGGFFAVDWRQAFSAFHWRGRLDLDGPARLALIDGMPVAGWTATLPGQAEKVALDGSASLERLAGAAEGMGGGAFRPRWIYFEPTPGANGAKAPKGAGWMLSMPGAVPAAGLEFKVREGLLSASLRDFDNRAGGGKIEGFYLALGLSSAREAAALHVKLTGKEGYWRPERTPRAWWSWPTLYLTSEWLERLGEEAAGEGADEKLFAALDGVARRFASGKKGEENGAILALDLAWCDAPGDWNPECPGLFADFAEWISFRDRLRERGHKVVLACAPLLASPESALAQEQDWALLRDANGGFAKTGDGRFLFLDATAPPVRDLLADHAAWLAGDVDEQSLGADGLVLEPFFAPPNAGVVWSDPARAEGEGLWARAMARVASAAAAVRADCLVECASADPMASRFANRFRSAQVFGLAEGGNSSPRAWESAGGLAYPRDLLPGALAVDFSGKPPEGKGPARPAGLVR